MGDHVCQGVNTLCRHGGKTVIKVRRTAVPFDEDKHGYVIRHRGGATIYLNRALYDDHQCAAVEALVNSGIGEGAIAWWNGELVQMDPDAVQPPLPIEQPAV